DVKTVMKNAGAAVMGTGEAEGENRAKRAAEAALASPLLNNRDIRGAQKILLSMVSGQEEELSMDELTIISEYIQEQAGDEAEVIFGHGVDATLEKNVRVTVIATGFDSEEEVPMMSKEAVKKPQPQPRKVYDLESSQPVAAPQPEPKPERQTSIEWTIGTRGPEVEPEPEQDDSRFRFTGASEPAPEEAEESVSPEMLADLEGQYEIVDAKPKNEYKSVEQRMDEIEENPPQPFDPSMDNKEYKKQQLLEQARRRVRALRANAERDEDDEIKEKLNMPAYLRRNVKLSEPPHSSEKNVSKYHLNDDNQLTSQNKWLHDNVD
ncbi:MAG TPA: cell division protein FtsZ, partial [Cytophagales bacterium]|nr:cell division protein FtsZ [Cytophagales bacterium]